MIDDPTDEDLFALSDAIADAQLMLTAFCNVGADRFDFMLKNVAGAKVMNRNRLAIDTLRKKLPSLLARGEAETLSLIIRPRSQDVAIIQLDDISRAWVTRLSPYSCCVIETSPGNFQAFVAVSGLVDKAGRESVRRRFIKALNADNATGATRIAGSLNVKEKHQRPDGSFPRVRLVSVAHGRIFTVSELEAASLLAHSPVAPTQPTPAPLSGRRRIRRVPSYEKAIRDTRPKADGEIDRSAVDMHYAVVCLDWGCSVEQTIDLLKRQSLKAAERSDDYVERTVANARQTIAERKVRRIPIDLLKK